MISIAKVASVTSCGFVMCLGFSTASLAIDDFAKDLKADKNAGRQDVIKKDNRDAAGISTIVGQVLHVEPDYYLVREFDGDLRRLYIDKNTKMTGNISLEKRVEAKVNDQNYALSIRSTE